MVKAETKPVWTSSSFLIYTGGLTVLEGAFAAFGYLAANYSGSGERTAWALLIFVTLAVIAHALRRADRWLPAGTFAFNAVLAWGLFVGLTLYWWGWENGTARDFRVWSWPRLLIEVLILLAATITRWRFKFPFIRLISAGVGVLFVIDLITKGHGNPVAVVSLLLGLAYLFYGSVSDKPSTFWLHLAAALLIGIPVIYWCHHSTFDFAVILFMSLVYVIWAYWTKRSSWAVFGAIGFYVAAGHFVVKAVESSIQGASLGAAIVSFLAALWYVPLAAGLLGFWLLLLGMLGKRKNRDMQTPVTAETKPVWTSSSFLVYAGGLTVLLGANTGLVYLVSQYHGQGARTGWALLFLVIVYGLAQALRLRGRWLAAGILAFVSVLVWATLVLLTMQWIGWHPFGVPGFNLLAYGSPLQTWSWSRMLFWVLILAAAWYDRRLFKFPFIRLISAVVSWLFIVDLLTSGFGNWFTVVTLLTGLAYLAIGQMIDKPSSFWLHLVGGALIGGAFLRWFHRSDGDFAVISLVSLAYVFVAYWTRRSVWAVYGTIGFFEATNHYVAGTITHLGPLGLLASSGSSGSCSMSSPGGAPVCTTVSGPWSPALAYGLLGFFLVALGMLERRKKAHATTTVVVTTPAPAAPAAPPGTPAPPAAPPAAPGPPAAADEPAPPADEPPAE